LPLGGQQLTGTVIGCKRQSDGTLKGDAHANPILDTRVYEVTFDDGQTAELAANTIAQNMFAQWDTEGTPSLLLYGIVDHRKDPRAITEQAMYIHRGSNQGTRDTSKGWQLCVEWKDGSTSWEKLATLKMSHPVEVAEYAVTHNLADDPAFACWVPQTLQCKTRIIATVNTRSHKRTHKFGIEVPRNFADCLRLGNAANKPLWQDAIRAEMTKVRVAFNILNDDAPLPPAHQQIRCHLIYDIKMENFQWKAHLVAGGHMTVVPATLTYASVVSRESVRMALTLAALNDLQV